MYAGMESTAKMTSESSMQTSTTSIGVARDLPPTLVKNRSPSYWSVASTINGVMSFMLESTPTVGSVETSLAERKRLAASTPEEKKHYRTICEVSDNRPQKLNIETFTNNICISKNPII